MTMATNPTHALLALALMVGLTIPQARADAEKPCSSSNVAKDAGPPPRDVLPTEDARSLVFDDSQLFHVHRSIVPEGKTTDTYPHHGSPAGLDRRAEPQGGTC
jgi:hypothetical protein